MPPLSVSSRINKNLNDQENSFSRTENTSIFSCKGSSLVAPSVKNLPTMWRTQVWFLGQEDPLEKGLATLSSILAWRIPWTEEPGGLQSTGSQRVRYDWATNTHILHISKRSRVTIYSLDVLLSQFGTSLVFHVQFSLFLLDLHTGFSRGRQGVLVFPTLEKFSTVCCDPHSQRL